jgi:hypothetical protein
MTRRSSKSFDIEFCNRPFMSKSFLDSNLMKYIQLTVMIAICSIIWNIENGSWKIQIAQMLPVNAMNPCRKRPIQTDIMNPLRILTFYFLSGFFWIFLSVWSVSFDTISEQQLRKTLSFIMSQIWSLDHVRVWLYYWKLYNLSFVLKRFLCRTWRDHVLRPQWPQQL